MISRVLACCAAAGIILHLDAQGLRAQSASGPALPWTCWVLSGSTPGVFPAVPNPACLSSFAPPSTIRTTLPRRSGIGLPNATPGAPTALSATVAGRTISLNWLPGAGDAPTSYVLEAGSSSGSSNVASTDTGSATPALVATEVPPGTYFIRVRAKNAGGTSGPSNEVVASVLGACVGAPGAPAGLTASANGSSVTLAWQAPTGSCPATTYVIEAGSATGLSDLASFSTGSSATTFSSSGVANGTYYVRVRSGNATGTSSPSNEAQLIVGTTGSGFRTGIYYRYPALDTPAARLAHVGDALDQVTPQVTEMPPVGWDMCRDYLVVIKPTVGLTLVTPSGQTRTVPISSIYSLARPSLSADCRYVAVQASATPEPPPTGEDLNIYVIDVQTGGLQRVGDLTANEESPRFFPSGHRLAYSSFTPVETNLHIYDIDLGRETGLLHRIGALQIAISPDGSQFIDPRVMRIYRLDTGAVVSDLLDGVVGSIQAAGFQLDQRFNDAGHISRGVYPLDAAFSPTGQQLVLDWAVLSGSTYGNVLVALSVSGSDFTVATPLISANPQFTNSNNFSQLNPIWK